MSLTLAGYRSCLAAAAACLLPLSAQAGNFNYTWAQFAYSDVTVDNTGGDFDGDAWTLSGAVELTDAIFVFGGYEYGDYDFNLETDTYQIGLGLDFPVGRKADLVFGLGYVDVSADLPGFGSIDDDGFTALGGVRAEVAPSFQVEAGLEYVDLSDGGDDTGFYAGGRYYFTPAWAVGLGYSSGDDSDAWTVSLRWELPR